MPDISTSRCWTVVERKVTASINSQADKPQRKYEKMPENGFGDSTRCIPESLAGSSTPLREDESLGTVSDKSKGGPNAYYVGQLCHDAFQEQRSISLVWSGQDTTNVRRFGWVSMWIEGKLRLLCPRQAINSNKQTLHWEKSQLMSGFLLCSPQERANHPSPCDANSETGVSFGTILQSLQCLFNILQIATNGVELVAEFRAI